MKEAMFDHERCDFVSLECGGMRNENIVILIAALAIASPLSAEAATTA